MAKALKHTVTLPCGNVATRTSKSRVYAFAVIGRLCIQEAHRRVLTDASYRAKSDWEYFTLCASVKVGERYPKAGYRFPVTQESHDKAAAAFAVAKTEAEYLDHLQRKYAAEVASRQEAGEFDRWAALSWSATQGNAEKAAQSSRASGRYAEVRVVPVRMTAPAWIKTRDFEGPVQTEEWTRPCGNWRVASNRMTRDSGRPYYVQTYRPAPGWVRSFDFPSRFKTEAAAMKAVEALLNG